MPDRLVIDASTGELTWVPLTAEEIAEMEARALESGQNSQVEQARTENESLICTRLEQAVADIQTAVAALDAGTIFGSLSNPEKAILKRLLRNQLGLIRLQLRLLDTAE